MNEIEFGQCDYVISHSVTHHFQFLYCLFQSINNFSNDSLAVIFPLFLYPKYQQLFNQYFYFSSMLKLKTNLLGNSELMKTLNFKNE